MVATSKPKPWSDASRSAISPTLIPLTMTSKTPSDTKPINEKYVLHVIGAWFTVIASTTGLYLVQTIPDLEGYHVSTILLTILILSKIKLHEQAHRRPEFPHINIAFGVYILATVFVLVLW